MRGQGGPGEGDPPYSSISKGPGLLGSPASGQLLVVHRWWPRSGTCVPHSTWGLPGHHGPRNAILSEIPALELKRKKHNRSVQLRSSLMKNKKKRKWTNPKSSWQRRQWEEESEVPSYLSSLSWNPSAWYGVRTSRSLVCGERLSLLTYMGKGSNESTEKGCWLLRCFTGYLK